MANSSSAKGYAVAVTSDGQKISYQEDFFAEGGEKRVHWAADGQHVVCFYKQQDPLRQQRLQQIIGVFNPTAKGQAYAEYWRSLFCWPCAMIVKPELGVLVPRYPSNFFFPDGMQHLSRQSKCSSWFTGVKTRQQIRTVRPQELGDFRSMILVATRLARAIRRMHAAGLAHSDLSGKNVLIDPKQGAAIIIDIDSLVVKNLYPPTVLGTSGFIAPEVLATQQLQMNDPRRKHPCIDTDKHALACLIYQYLLLRHPLDGPQVHDEDPYLDDLLRYGERALFIEHPHDHRNRPPGLSPTIDDLGPYIAPLFIKTFVDGLHRPEARALAAEWEQALVKTYNLLLPCANAACEQRCFPALRSDHKPPRSLACPFCKTALPGTYPVLNLYRPSGNQYQSDFSIVGYHGLPIFPYHVYTDKFTGETVSESDSQPVATIEHHHQRWILRNHRLPGMRSAQGNLVMPGQAALLAPGTRITLDSSPTARIASIQFIP